MKTKRLFLLTLCLSCYVFTTFAQKQHYIPREWRNRTDTLIYKEYDPDNRYTWSESRSRESNNVILYWDKYYGSTLPNDAPEPYRFDVNDMIEKAESFYQTEMELGFVSPDTSNLAKYKLMILMHHFDGWICTGAGYDFEVPAIWLSPSTAKPVGQSIAHEIGHAFHYMCYAEASKQGTLPEVQTGFHTTYGQHWEQTAQWQSLQSYPELMFSQSMFTFRLAHNYAMSHEWQRYQSYWWFYYLCQKYNDIRTVANVWNYPETEVKDFNEVLMDYKNLSVVDLFRLYYEYAAQCATFDFDVAAPYRDNYIGDFRYNCIALGDHDYQVSYSSVPQSTGFNIIPLNVPDAGTEVTTHFTALPAGSALAEGDPSLYLDGRGIFTESGKAKYNHPGALAASRGFRLGYVALMRDSTRCYFHVDSVYCTGTNEETADVSFTVPEGTDRIWLVVVPALKDYKAHVWDENFENDDQWPYRFVIEGTDLNEAAEVVFPPTLDGRNVGNVKLTYDVWLTPKSDYSGTALTIDKSAAATLGTAFQMNASQIAGKLVAYNSAGPAADQIMFYPAYPDGSLQLSGSTANGYGHWFDANGKVINWGAGSYVYSEFTPSTLTFYIGQYPNRCHNGDEYTIAQAFYYSTAENEKARALVVFNIHFSNTHEIGTSLAGMEYDDPTGIEKKYQEPSTKPAEVYDLSGRKLQPSTLNLKRGIYIINGEKVLVRH
jgi:hypothetical protein